MSLSLYKERLYVFSLQQSSFLSFTSRFSCRVTTGMLLPDLSFILRPLPIISTSSPSFHNSTLAPTLHCHKFFILQLLCNYNEFISVSLLFQYRRHLTFYSSVCISFLAHIYILQFLVSYILMQCVAILTAFTSGRLVDIRFIMASNNTGGVQGNDRMNQNPVHISYSQFQLIF